MVNWSHRGGQTGFRSEDMTSLSDYGPTEEHAYVNVDEPFSNHCRLMSGDQED